MGFQNVKIQRITLISSFIMPICLINSLILSLLFMLKTFWTCNFPFKLIFFKNTNYQIFVLLPIRVELFPLSPLSQADKGLTGRISLIKLCLNQIKNKGVLIICSGFISNLSSVFLSKLFVISVFILWSIFKGAFRFICILNLNVKSQKRD